MESWLDITSTTGGPEQLEVLGRADSHGARHRQSGSGQHRVLRSLRAIHKCGFPPPSSCQSASVFALSQTDGRVEACSATPPRHLENYGNLLRHSCARHCVARQGSQQWCDTKLRVRVVS